MKYMLLLLMLMFSIVDADNKGMINSRPMEIKVEVVKKEVRLYDIDTLAAILGKLESSNNYRAIHPITKTMGKYQFRKQTLDMLNIVCTDEEFLSDSVLQEKAFRSLVLYQYQFMKNHNVLSKVGTKTVDGIPITTEGLIMAAHLCGAVSVYDYIVNENIENRVIQWGKKRVRVYKKDLNGTTIQSYLRRV